MNEAHINVRASDFSDGTTVISAVKNRSEPLRYTLASWLLQKSVDRIILVDWDSSTPLIYSLAGYEMGLWPNDKVTIVRVENQPTWNLPKAINCGMKLVETSVTLKLDADVVIVDVLDDLNLAVDGAFFTTYGFKPPRTSDEVHLFGSVAFATYDFWRIGGYDERFSTYGYEDDNFYSRLQAAGVGLTCFKENTMFHLPHSDASRTAHQNVKDGLRKSIARNRKLSRKRTKWTWYSPRVQYELLARADDDRYFVVREQPSRSNC